jgi:hypothetical protein
MRIGECLTTKPEEERARGNFLQHDAAGRRRQWQTEAEGKERTVVDGTIGTKEMSEAN